MPPKRTTRAAIKAASQNSLLAMQPPAKKSRKGAAHPKKTVAKRANDNGKKKSTSRLPARDIALNQGSTSRTLSPVIRVLLPVGEETDRRQGNGDWEYGDRGTEDNRSVSSTESGWNYNMPLPTTGERGLFSSTARPSNINFTRVQQPAGSPQNESVFRNGRRPRVPNITNIGAPAGDPMERFTQAIQSTLRTVRNQPIILAGEHPVTRLLIKVYHCKYYHANSDTVVKEIRQRFHIVGLRQSLRSIVSKCVTCKELRGKPQSPMMASLPADRLAYKRRPFSHCGIDYFGPMLVKIGRRREKRWGVLFTCLTTRAIHLELAHSLTAGSAIMALQRLSARRGCPVVMYSDNGTNRGACSEFKNAVKSLDINEQRGYALKNGMQWLFNPPDAPHMGGAWERLVRSVKTALRVVLTEQVVSGEVLYTLLTEIEHSVNSRPLTHVSVDPRDAEALTPNHLLIGCSSDEIKLGKNERWLREYLPTLLPRKK
ncbi:hypothetical protein TSAR_015066 [Trichomalopsis sarcophagae]|uniref:Integrase catalytic domain-containing protein n=1 Tax=Trichomalopsis sarcophagae TaxID=543379 RepID=A0A232EEF8_9HYME|nr:hypothetical protein TSAR_015066 [Trichomalopsis sarcophagae]